MAPRVILALVFSALVLALGGAPAPAFAQLLYNPNANEVGNGLPSDPQGAISQARARIAAGDMAGAIALLQKYVAAHLNENDPRRFLGDLYYRNGDFTKAEMTYRTILAYSPYDKETHNRLGTVYATENRVDDAIGEFNKSLPGTDSVDDLVALHERRGDLAAYRREMEQTAAHNPNDPDILSELGQVYTAIHRPADALPVYKRALDVDPASLGALNGLGLAYLTMHDSTDAVKTFVACLKIDPTVYSCLSNLGGSYLEAGRFDDAQPVLERANKIAPERYEALVDLGYLADERDDWKAGVAYYVKALNVWPYASEAYVDLGSSYEEHALYPLAQAVLVKGIAVAPQDGRIHFLLGRCYALQGENALAIEQYEAASKSLDPDIVRIARIAYSELESATSPKLQ